MQLLRPQSISNVPERQFELVVAQGATFGPLRHYLTNPLPADAPPDAVPVPMDLTGATLRGQVRKTFSSAEVAATFDIVVAADPTEGWYELTLPHAQTAALTCGKRRTDEASRYVWDVELVDTLGRVMRTLFGPLLVDAEVTREVAP